MNWGRDGWLIACGTRLGNCVKAAAELREEGLDVGVVNARFIKPLDREMVERSLRESSFVVTVEEGCLMGGFGSAFLETASELGLDTSRVHRLGIPDRLIEHADRGEPLADQRPDTKGASQTRRALADPRGMEPDAAAVG